MSIVTQGYGTTGYVPTPTTQYPDAAALKAFVVGAAFANVEADLAYQRIAAAAVNRFESDTNRTGLYSFAASCPEDVYHAILCIGAVMLVGTQASANGGAGAIQGIKQDDVQINFAAISTTVSQYSAQQLQLMDVYADAVRRHRRLVLV